MEEQDALARARIEPNIMLQVECRMEIFSSFFGVNGDQPDCGHTFTIEVEEASLERRGDEVSPCYSVECPKCSGVIEPWCESWEVIDAT